MTEPSQYDALKLLRSENGLSLSEARRRACLNYLKRGDGIIGLAERNTRSMRTTRLRGTRNVTISSLFHDRQFEKRKKTSQLMCEVSLLLRGDWFCSREVGFDNHWAAASATNY